MGSDFRDGILYVTHFRIYWTDTDLYPRDPRSVLCEEAGEPPQVQVDHTWSRTLERLPHSLLLVCQDKPVVGLVRSLRVQYNVQHWQAIGWKRLDSLLIQSRDLVVAKFHLKSFEYGLGRDDGKCAEIAKDITRNLPGVREKYNLKIYIEEDEKAWRKSATRTSS